MTPDRAQPRQPITGHSIRAHNQMTDRDMGELVNLTTEGMMLISDNPIHSNAVYQFALAPEKAGRDGQLIELGVECLWCRRSDHGPRYWSGYQIIDASRQALKAVDDLLIQESLGAQPLEPFELAVS